MAVKKRSCFVQGCISVAAVFAVAVGLVMGLASIEGKMPSAILNDIGKVGVVEYFSQLFAGEPITEQANVIGIYCYLVESHDDPGGAHIPAQYWSYAFLNDGTFRTYLEAAEQFGGTWSQQGSNLKVNVDPIADLTEGYTWEATVSSDATTISTGTFTLTKSPEVCSTGK